MLGGYSLGGLHGGSVSVLLFGVSHRSAPVSVLEQLSTDEADQAKIIEKVLQSPLVTEAMVLSTCNRVEVYAVVEAFHGGLSTIGQVLADQSGMSLGDLTKFAYVRYAEAAAATEQLEHALTLAQPEPIAEAAQGDHDEQEERRRELRRTDQQHGPGEGRREQNPADGAGQPREQLLGRCLRLQVE